MATDQVADRLDHCPYRCLDALGYIGLRLADRGLLKPANDTDEGSPNVIFIPS
jgi:hypothetical protein